jgi:hypothetical protein
MTFHLSPFGRVDFPEPVERRPYGRPDGVRTVRRPSGRPTGRV